MVYHGFVVNPERVVPKGFELSECLRSTENEELRKRARRSRLESYQILREFGIPAEHRKLVFSR